MNAVSEKLELFAFSKGTQALTSQKIVFKHGAPCLNVHWMLGSNHTSFHYLFIAITREIHILSLIVFRAEVAKYQKQASYYISYTAPPLLNLSLYFCCCFIQGPHSVYFTIGSVDTFERKLENAQQSLNVDPIYWVPVTYAEEIDWG